MLGSQAINWQGGECGDPVIRLAAIIALIFRNMPGAGNAWNEYRNVACLFLECGCHDGASRRPVVGTPSEFWEG
ncbi:MAG TPA: hypothetical protein DFK19_13325 [Ochrobactrum sp.]|nr:hypothetical protein [Ochrobactrum sp.]